MAKNKKESFLTIGDVAKSFGVSDNTIRRMEAAGLLSPGRVDEGSGYRYYDRENLAEIALILDLKHFGFTQGEIRGALAGGDGFAGLYETLRARQTALDRLVARMEARLPRRERVRAELTDLPDLPCMVRPAVLKATREALSEGIREALFQAVRRRLPVDFTQGVMILSEFRTLEEADWSRPQPLRFCVPLRRPAAEQDTAVIPGGAAVALSWSAAPADLSAIADSLRRMTEAYGLRRRGTLRGTFPVGSHTRPGLPAEEHVMTLYVPVE